MKNSLFGLLVVALLVCIAFSCNKSNDEVLAPQETPSLLLSSPDGKITIAKSVTDLKQRILNELASSNQSHLSINIDDVSYEVYPEATIANVSYTLSNGYMSNIIFYNEQQTLTAEEATASSRTAIAIEVPPSAARCSGNCGRGGMGCIIAYSTGVQSYQCICFTEPYDGCTIHGGGKQATCDGRCCKASYNADHRLHFCICDDGTNTDCTLSVTRDTLEVVAIGL